MAIAKLTAFKTTFDADYPMLPDERLQKAFGLESARLTTVWYKDLEDAIAGGQELTDDRIKEITMACSLGVRKLVFALDLYKSSSQSSRNKSFLTSRGASYVINHFKDEPIILTEAACVDMVINYDAKTAKGAEKKTKREIDRSKYLWTKSVPAQINRLAAWQGRSFNLAKNADVIEHRKQLTIRERVRS